MIRSILRGGLVAVLLGSLGLVLGCGKGDSVAPKATTPVDPAIKRVQNNATGPDGKPAGGGAKSNAAVNAN